MKRRVVRARKQKGVMNKLEKLHSETVLDGKEWKYESITFRLADRTTYTPDFVFVNGSDQLEIHEVKGGVWLGDSRVKFKAAAELYPWFLWKSYLYKGKAVKKIEVI